MRFRSYLLILLFMLGIPFMNISCSTSDEQQQQEDVLDEEEQQQDEDDQEDEENQQEGDQEENLNNVGNENLNNAGFNNEGGNNQFLNNEGNQLGNDIQADLGNEELQNEGELQQIIEDMNNSNNDQFAQQDAAMNDQMAMNNQMQNDGMMNNAGQDFGNQGMDNMQQGMDQMQAMNEAPMEQTSGASTGSPMAPGLPELGSKMSYIVQKGDTLAKIATRIYGDPKKWGEIADFTGIANPRLIYPGDVVYYQLTEQTMAFASNYESVSRSEVRVMEGDTLSTIASRVLGNSSNWKMIWRQNDSIANPDRLVVGSTLYYIEPGMLTAALDSVNDIKEKVVDAVVTQIAENLEQAPAEEMDVSTESELINADETGIDQDFVQVNADFARII